MPARNSTKDRAAILQTTIDELRRVDSWLDSTYARIKNRCVTYLGGGLVALTFLYSGGDTFIPHEIYGKIFYFTGLGLVIAGLVTLFIALLPRHWEFSIEDEDIEALEFSSHIQYLEYVKKRYLVSYRMNLKTYERTNLLMRMGFFPLVFGVIILTVLKLFGA